MRRCKYPKGKRVIGFNIEGVSFQNVVVREVTPVDEFYFEKTRSSDDNAECVAFVDPIRMLFNQKRLSDLGAMPLQGWLDSLKNTSKDPLSELRKKCTDVDLIQMIKSRHIQQPSELMAWVQYTQANMAEFEAEAAKLLQERQAQVDANKIAQNVEVPTKSE